MPPLSRDAVLVLFERLNRSGDLNVILGVLREHREKQLKRLAALLERFDPGDSKELDTVRKLQGGITEVARMERVFASWGARKGADKPLDLDS